MIKINGDEVTEHEVEYGVAQYNSDLSVRILPCESQEEAERTAIGFGGFAVARNVYYGSWQSTKYPLVNS